MKKRNAIFSRFNVFVTMLLSSVIPCVLATVFLAVIFLPLMNRSAKENDRAYEENLLYAAAGQFSDLFTSFDNAVAVVETNDWIFPLFLDALVDKSPQSSTKNIIQKELSMTCIRSSYQQFSFMYYGDSTLYSDSGVYNDQARVLELSDELDYHFYHTEAITPAVSTIVYDDTAYLLYQAPFRVITAGNYRGEVNILVRSSVLGGRLEKAVGANAAAFRLTDLDGNTLWEHNTGLFSGETATLSQLSDSGQFYYCVDIPLNIHSRTRDASVPVMFGALASSLVISLVLCYILCRFTYQPVQRLVYKIMGTDEHSNNNFDMLERVFDGILEEKSLIENSLAQLQPIAHQRILGSLLDGSAFLDDFEGQLENCGIRFDYESFNVIVLELPFSQVKDAENKAKLAMESLLEAMSGQMPVNAYLYYENCDHYRIVINYDTWERLQAYISVLFSNIEQYFRDHAVLEGIYLGVGQAVDSPEELYRAADQAETAFSMAAMNRLGQPMFYREVAPELNYEYFYPMSEELLLSRAITNCNLASAKSVLCNVLEENRKNVNLSPKCLLYLYMDLFSTVARSGQSLGIRIEPMDTRVRHPSLDEIGDHMEKMIDQICAQIMEKRSKTVNPTERKILEYIESHVFASNLSLNSVGEAFQVSPGHVSNIFKAHRETNFNNYVNQTRIMRAIQLMAEEGLDSNSVYPLVGYTNLTTFRRNFNKFAKRNPGQIFQDDVSAELP